MNVVLVPTLRFFVGIIWVIAAVITLVLVAPFQLVFMISTYVLQPQRIRI